MEIVTKPQLSESLLSDAYWDHVLSHGKEPSSVYALCKKIGIQEPQFYQHYGSFQALTRSFWERTITDTQSMLDQDADYQEYDARAKLLAFFYTYFENTLQYRSRFLASFPRRQKAALCPSLKGMKSAFDHSSKTLMAEVVSEGKSNLPSQWTEKGYKGGWPVFLYLIEFWLNDSSKGFQDTDSLIEKLVTFGHDITHFSPFDSAIDLGRFILGRSL